MQIKKSLQKLINFAGLSRRAIVELMFTAYHWLIENSNNQFFSSSQVQSKVFETLQNVVRTLYIILN